ncbi:hypothetical protein CAOG_08709 [Capsaspora owczarzaki ATCC 30864]|uniref:PRA1 family protein n=1 Tax=Capsaspora owczarzaki (strain ATCC 30864) TaxID=595528 RepID=A0A0D2UC23_CAPO3|nr:hypothetical protein CAOG_08709 [Capsaspora owczarzaki ATCC 30864]KJE92566.1 hypothetical protein CAOG_008709 [Capsaspora owczarzaki ATCC 30864]|eukprot:XP_011270329.1 hypothetical protein CAOG_08709 [Capsaspora owczarzaki ATCC 30864]
MQAFIEKFRGAPNASGSLDQLFQQTTSHADPAAITTAANAANNASAAPAPGFMTPASLAQSARQLHSQMPSARSWTEFLNAKRLSRPAGMGDLSARLWVNISHFQANYFAIFVALVIYCILTSPTLFLSLLVIIAVMALIALRQGRPLHVGGKEYTSRDLYMAVATVSIPLLFFASAGSAVFWVLGASIFVIVGHAVFMEIDPAAHAAASGQPTMV